ncbi:MAG TPA: nitronate monooxygenase [Oculatellaceae cyanobacterium]
MSFRATLGIKHPIIQAPMAGSDNPTLVAAASNSGVLGSLGAQYRSPEEIRKAIQHIRDLTDKPFAINLFALPKTVPPTESEIRTAATPLERYYAKFNIQTPTPASVRSTIDAEAQLQVLLDERVPIFSFTLGVPDSKWLDAFRENGTLLIGTATNIDEALLLERSGVDALTAQGTEAGGHRGTFIGAHEDSMVGLMSLIPELVDTVKIPVIAAGGIMDGRGIAAAFALGAQAVQLGTAFLGVNECSVHQAYKDALKTHTSNQTKITKVFSGGAARGIDNEFMHENAETPLLPFPYHNSLTRPIRKVANESGLTEYTNLWSGQSGRLLREVSTNELVKALIDETKSAVDNLFAACVAMEHAD